MMYNNKLVMVVKVNGKVMREQDDGVFLPFGSEYSISLKNLHTTKVKIDIDIDGDDILNNRSILLNPNESIDLDGFLDSNRVSNRFKFIEKTNQISEYRGDNIDDGVIKVTYVFEQSVVNYIPNIYNNNYPYNTPIYGNVLNSQTSHNTSYTSCDNVLVRGILQTNDGITVKGSDTSNQRFVNGSIGKLENEKHSMVLFLRGYDSNNVFIPTPITVKTKLKCKTCGCISKSCMKFCGNCGTSLI